MGGVGGVGGSDMSQVTSNNGLTSVIKAGDKPRHKYKEEQDPGEPGVWPGEVVTGDQVSYDQPADLTRPVNTWPGGDNHEEELVQYFQHQDITENDNDNDEKLSQLRQLLAKNLTNGQMNNSSGAFKRTNVGGGKLETVISSGGGGHVPAGVDTVSVASVQNNLSSRRRVSFHPLIVSDSGDQVPSVQQTGVQVQCPIPPSPSRRRHFSFQPISPRACQPGASGGSPPASPFISPRSTPVHMLRSRHSSGSALPLHLLPGNYRVSHSTGSDVSKSWNT